MGEITDESVTAFVVRAVWFLAKLLSMSSCSARGDLRP